MILAPAYTDFNLYDLYPPIERVPQANGYRLPTIDEWEYAALAGSKNTYAGSHKAKDVAVVLNNVKKSYLPPVATKKANQWGLYDMSGLVWEWCFPIKKPSKPNQNNIIFGCRAALKGGSYYNPENEAKINNIYWSSPYLEKEDIGFRVVKSL